MSFKPMPISGNTLLVLDDASRYGDKDRLVDFVLERNDNIELLLLDRPIFKDGVENQLREKTASFGTLEIELRFDLPDDPRKQRAIELTENLPIEP